ncbi:MAG: hypothetical protein PVH89_03790 [Gammaproteobacteria bacterium]|jgi:hypothetical protein
MSDREAIRKVLACYRCGESLAALSLPLSRLDLCPGCGVELHVCRMCTQYAPSAPDSCLEEDAPEFRNKTAANFCDYFRPNPEAFNGSEKRAEDCARAQLDSLFGSDEEQPPREGEGSEEDAALRQAEDLFK